MRLFYKLFAALAIAGGARAQGPGEPIAAHGNWTIREKELRRPIVIAADNITIDGGGSVVIGPGVPGKPDTFAGDGISASGRKNITIKNIHVRGFRRGVRLSDCEGVALENVDASSNYSNPDFGWGDLGRVGGVILDRVRRSSLLRCAAKNNWNGVDLWQSDANVIDACDASHCSNVCLKLETSSGNVIKDCDLSYGIRISPGEVHARDSTGVLIESGSDRNRFERNNITRGGDGVFIRVLNGWMSTGNVFIENDCSYANNNGFESWSRGNAYYRNRANYCSFGFWLGGSDATILEGNEAGWNGLPGANHNAPEPDFRHGGIVIVGGTGSHSVIDGNYCHDNAGAGIVFRGDLASRGERWKMLHLIVQRNRLENNEWGLVSRFAEGLLLAENQYKNNRGDEWIEETAGILRLSAPAAARARPRASLAGPSRAAVGETITFDASGSAGAGGARLYYELNVTGERFERVAGPFGEPKCNVQFSKPGFYRIAATVHDGALGDAAYLDCYVAAAGEMDLTENGAACWRAAASEAGTKVNIGEDRGGGPGRGRRVGARVVRSQRRRPRGALRRRRAGAAARFQ